MFNFFKQKASQAKNESLLDPNQAVECYKQGNYQEALMRADAMIQAAPSVALSYRFKGEVLLEMQRYQEAIAAFSQAEKIGGPGTEELCCFRALAYINLGDTRSALALLNAQLKAKTCSPELSIKIENMISKLSNSTHQQGS